MGTRASNVVKHIYAAASFRLKVRIESVGGNREGVLFVATDNCVSVRKRR